MGDRVIAFGKYDLGYPKCPIQIEQYKLFYSEDDRKTYICFKFVNFFDVEIKELRFNLVCFDKNKKPIGAFKDYYYSPKIAKKYSEFGYENKFEIPCYGCQTAMLAFSTVTFNDGNVWKYQENMFPPIPKSAKPITPDIPHFQQINLELKKFSAERIKFNPLFTAHGWICTCGMVNIVDDEDCLSCKINRYNLMDSFNDEYLVEQEKIERARKEKEIQEREAKLKKQREAVALNNTIKLDLVEIKKPNQPKKEVKPLVLEELVLEEVKPAQIKPVSPRPQQKPVENKQPKKEELLDLNLEELDLVEEKEEKKPLIKKEKVEPKPIEPLKPIIKEEPKKVEKPVEPKKEKPVEIKKEEKKEDLKKKEDKVLPKEEKKDKFHLFKKDKPQKEDIVDSKKKTEDKKEEKIEKKEETVIAPPKKENSSFGLNFDDVDKPMESKKKEEKVVESQEIEDEIIAPLDLSDWLV